MLAISDFVINEFLADPAATVPAGDANGDGLRDSSDDEFVELVNTGADIDIGGWTLSDNSTSAVRHTFPSPTSVAAGQAVVIFGGGTPLGSFGGAIVQTASAGSLSLNNGGDVIKLEDGAGGEISVTYGSEAGDNQSLTRSPDITGSFVKHSSLGGLDFTPGFETDGTTAFSSNSAGGGGGGEGEGGGETTPPETSVAQNIFINELDSDTEDENNEFIELSDGSVGNTALDGLVLVLFNGSSGASYAAYDLDGFSTDANGFFVIGDSDVPNVDFVPPGFDGPSPVSPGSDIQNGEDAVAVFIGNASDFPNGTLASSTSLLDAIVYETGADANSDLPSLLGVGSPIDEAENQEKDTESISRGASENYGAGTPTPGTANIEPTLPPGKLSVLDATLDESTPFGTILIRLSEPQAGSVVVTANVIEGTATSEDFAVFSPQITFLAGETLKTLPVSIVNDSLAEGPETFTVELTNPSGATIDDGTALITIADDEPPLISISDVSVSESDGSAEFTVSLTSPAEFPFTVDVATIAGSAIAPADFTAISSQILFGIGESEQVLSIPVIDDDAPEPAESFEVMLSNPSTLAVSIDDATGIGTIRASDNPVATHIVINEFDSDTVDENREFIELYDGGSGNTLLYGLVVVLLNGNRDVVYDAFDLDGFSTDAAGFFVLGDGDVVGVDLVPTDFDAAGTSSPGSDLQNGEDAIALYVGDSADFSDGTSPTMTGLLDAVVYETGPDADSELPTLLGLDTVIDEDATGDGSELSLSRLPNGTGDFAPATPTPNAMNVASVVLRPQIAVSGNDQEIAAGDNTPDVVDGTDFGSLTVDEAPVTRTFTISNEGDGPLKLAGITLSVEADATADFTLTSPANLTIAPSESEDFTITLTPKTAGTQRATITITSDDADESSFVFAVAAEVADVPPEPIEIWLNEIHYDNVGPDSNEFVEVAGAAGVDITGASILLYNGGTGLVYKTIALTGVIDDEGTGTGAISFDATGIQNGPDGIAVINTDGTVIEFISYEGAFEALDGLAIRLTSTDVGVVEPGEESESLQRLENTADSEWSGPLPASAGNLNVAPVILDPTLSIAALDTEKLEGKAGTTEFLFEVTRDGDVSETTDVDFAVAHVSTDADDFGGSLPRGTVSFDENETKKTVAIGVSGDDVVEADETFTVTLSNPTGAATISTASAEGTIQNDDVLVPDFAFVTTSVEQPEGDTEFTEFLFQVTRTGDLSIPELIDYTVSSTDADTDAADFGGILPSGTLLFAADETTQSITISVAGDEAVEADETFTVTLSNASHGGTISLASSVGVIENDDDDPEPVDPEPVDPLNDSIRIDKRLWDINGRPALHHNLNVGDELIYSFDVTNTGNTTLRNIVVSDPLPGLVMDKEVIEAYIGYSQPAETPAGGDLGPFASVDSALASDPAEARAWDNFTLRRGTVVDGLSWTGAYVEQFASGPDVVSPETDFLIEFFTSESDKPGDVIHSFTVDGGLAGVEDGDVTSTLVADVTTAHDGPVYEYMAMLPFTYLLPGDYWISVTALQTFPNPTPAIDPTWQWHLAGDGDGFYSYDDLFDDEGDGIPVPSLFIATKDLAFTLHAARLVDDFNNTLEPGETVMFMGTYYVTQEDLDAGFIANTGTVTADGQTGSVSESDEFIWATKSAKLSIQTFANGANVSAPVALQVGAALTWTYEVTNTGNVDLTNVDVTDPSTTLSFNQTTDNGDGVLSPGETWQFTSDTSSTDFGLQRNTGIATAESEVGDAFDVGSGYYVGQCIPQQHADMNGDGKIAFQDFLNFRVAFGQEVAGGPTMGDFDCNGVVDFADFLVLSEQYGRSLDELFASDELNDVMDEVQLAVSPGRRDRS